MFRDYHAEATDKRGRPEWRRLGEAYPHGEWVDRFDFDILVVANRRGGRCRISGILPVEHHIVCCERLAVVPLDVVLELPDHRHTVGCNPTVLYFRDLGGEHWRQIALLIPGRK